MDEPPDADSRTASGGSQGGSIEQFYWTVPSSRPDFIWETLAKHAPAHFMTSREPFKTTALKGCAPPDIVSTVENRYLPIFKQRRGR